MPIADDLRAIADRANRELDAAHDFFEYSKTVWESYGLFVDAGHLASFENAETGTKVDQVGLLALAPGYVSDYLTTFTFRQFVSTFEPFFFAFFHRILQHNPWPYGRSQLELDAVLKARDRDEVISVVLLKQLNELRYANVRDWFEAVNKAAKLGCPTDDETDSLAEIKATRDLLEHNAGVVNDVYLRKAGKKARYAAGEPVDLDNSYHLASWRLIKKIVVDLTTSATTKMAKP